MTFASEETQCAYHALPTQTQLSLSQACQVLEKGGLFTQVTEAGSQVIIRITVEFIAGFSGSEDLL